MWVNWSELDILTSKGIALISFLVYLGIYLRIKISSSVRMLKVILALFVLGTAAMLGKMYLVPIAKTDAEIDSLTIGTIFVCTISTSTNVANWLFATTYFSTAHKFKEILS